MTSHRRSQICPRARRDGNFEYALAQSALHTFTLSAARRARVLAALLREAARLRLASRLHV
jgi:hypothetical protein